MKVRPLNTLALRIRLRAEGKVNSSRVHRLARNEVAHVPYPEFNSVERINAEIFVEIHPYALIGHQVSSWIAGYLWSKELGIDYAGGSLSRDTDGFFDFSSHESRALEDVKVVRLKAVGDERDLRSLRDLQRQVARAQRKYPDRALSFRLALDPARWDQTKAQDETRKAVLSGSRGNDLRTAETEAPYAAIHIRRGRDISTNHISAGVNRWVVEDDYVALIKQLRGIPELHDLEIRIYSLGEAHEFQRLEEAGAVLYLGGSRDSDLIALSAAKILVLSPSSFSFTAALISRSVVLGRIPWWHHVPGEGRWVHISPDWTFDTTTVSRALTVGR